MSRVLTAVLVLAVGCGPGAIGNEGAQSLEQSVTTNPIATGVHVAKGELLLKGKPWTPKGVSLIGALTCDKAIAAHQRWGPGELRAIKNYGAEAIRLQVSQPALAADYANPAACKSTTKPCYLDEVKAMVALARQPPFDFVVVLSMQDQVLACGNSDELPSESTQNAWRLLAPLFRSDPSVIYELFNEPYNGTSDSAWTEWLTAHEAVLNVIRREARATNVVFVDGEAKAEFLPNQVRLADPLDQLVYAVHPYGDNNDPSEWNTRFGDFAEARIAPVVVSEYNAYSTETKCQWNSKEVVKNLLPYLKKHDIGIFGWAFDLPGTLFKEEPGDAGTTTPTSYCHFQCGAENGGIGEMLHTYFETGTPVDSPCP